MVSMAHADYALKPLHGFSKENMEKTKEHHQNCHFVLGSYESQSIPVVSNKEESFTSPSTKKNLDKTPNIIFGNFKNKLITETQNNFTAKTIQKTINPPSNMRNTNFLLGTDNSLPLPLSAESYQGKQIIQKIETPISSSQQGVVFGNSSKKWESSYKESFYERSFAPRNNTKIDKNSSINLGYYDGEQRSVSHDSYQSRNHSKNSPLRPLAQLNSFYIGKYNKKIETINSGYGKALGPKSVIEPFMLEKIKGTHFSFGHEAPQYISKKQTDYQAPGIKKDKEKLINSNKACSIFFGENKNTWESTYKDLCKTNKT